MTAETLGNLLVRHGLIDRLAIQDPEGFDGSETKWRVGAAAQEITAMEKTTEEEDQNSDWLVSKQVSYEDLAERKAVTTEAQHEQGKDQREGVADGGGAGAAGHGCACRRIDVGSPVQEGEPHGMYAEPAAGWESVSPGLSAGVAGAVECVDGKP